MTAGNTAPDDSMANSPATQSGAWLHWRARPIMVVGLVAAAVLGVHVAIAHLRADVFTDYQAAGPIAVGAALAALASAHVDEPPGLSEMHARAIRSQVSLYVAPRVAVFTIATVGLSTALWDVSDCGPIVAVTNVSLLLGLALLLTSATNRAIGGVLPAIWVASLVASADASGALALLWRLPLVCAPPTFITVTGVAMAAIGIALPPRRTTR